MALTFAIENRANLPDGGPLDISVTGRRGIDIGRDQHLDWSLPDPARVVSSKHCEVRFREGAYWLIDVSTNGTFVNGSPHRMQGPHRLRNGDRLEIGHYIINVLLEGEAGAEAAPIDTPSNHASDLWSGVAPPMNITSPAPSGSDHVGHADALDWFADIPIPELPPPLELPKADNAWMQPLASAAPSAASVPAPSAWGAAPAPDSNRVAAREERAPPAPADFAGLVPPARQTTAPPDGVFATPALPAVEFIARTSPAPVAPPVPDQPRPTPKAAEAAIAAPSPAPFERVPRTIMREGFSDPTHARFLELIAQGAGLPVEIFQQQSPEKAAEIIGGMLRVTVDELRSFLQARAETKGLVRSTNQTMIQAFENNPLKFSPSTEEAMRKMLASDNRSYLSAIDAFQQSFKDLKTHQLNTYGAMQQALQMLVEDFDPATIERMTEQESGLGSVMSNRKAKLWESFKAKWKAKVGRHDNGLLDVFMIYFAECYDRMTNKLR